MKLAMVAAVLLVAGPASAQVQVVAGSYGVNCGAKSGNKTDHLAKTCNGQMVCRYKVDHTVIGDPAVGCGKTYFAEWRCGNGKEVYKTEAPAEAGFGSVIELSCQQQYAGVGINVVAGTYGANCGAQPGNKTDHLAKSCNGQSQCRYKVDHTVIGDPAVGCGKTYVAEWRCASGGQVFRAEAPAEAGFGSVLELSCGPGQQQQYAGPGISVVAGTYGANCGAQPGNKTDHLARACNGQSQCKYKIDHTVIGDPAAGCGKTYIAEWRCGSNSQVHRAEAPAEAGFGSVIELSCAQGPNQPPPPAGNGIGVIAATYGGNCRAQAGNKTDALARACNGMPRCDYVVDYQVIGDPAVGCPKDYVAQWQCGQDPNVYSVTVPPEAGFKKTARLICP